MKKLIITLILVLVFLASCSPKGFSTSDYDVEATAAKLLETEALGNGIVYQNGTTLELTSDLCDFYFDEEDLLFDVSSYVFITSSNEHVCEAGVFKVNNPDAIDDVIDAFRERQESLIQIHTNYDQSDLAISKGMTTGSFNDVVWFAATADNAAIEEIIKK